MTADDRKAGPPKGTVLVVDDEEVDRLVLAQMVRAEGYQALVAGSGEEAVAVWKAHRRTIDVIVMDWLMPAPDGIQVTRTLREQEGDSYVPILLVTGRHSPGDVILALDSGANDFLSKPVSPSELAARLRSMVRLRHMDAELRHRNEILRRDLDAARQLQMSLIPPSPLRMGNLRFAWRYIPSHFVAGDTLNVFPLPDGRVGFHVVDVTGHGVAAALLGIWLNRTLLPASQITPAGPRSDPGLAPAPITSPGQVCRHVDRTLSRCDPPRFATAVYCVHDPGRGELTYCRAGHPYPILCRPRQASRKLDGGSPLLGLGLDQVPEELTVPVQPGDRLVLHSDGLTDVRSPAGESFGSPRLLEHLDRHQGEEASALLESLLAAAHAFSGNAAFRDDVTVMVVDF